MQLQQPLKSMESNDQYGVIVRGGRFAWDKQDEEEDNGDVTMGTKPDQNGSVPAVTYRPISKTEKVDFSIQCDLGSDDEEEDENANDKKKRGDSEREFKPEGAITEQSESSPEKSGIVVDATRRKSWNGETIQKLVDSAKTKRKERVPPPEEEVSTALYDLNFVLEKVTHTLYEMSSFDHHLLIFVS